jgi:site-specific DNA recombinase
MASSFSDSRSAAVPDRVRCAVYTRKSTEEGLDQEFNSLQAQREAAEAYIKSQRHLGWTLVPRHYDDGGFSGGNLDRPALARLLEDVDAQRINCVVVYKVDRLSRSLLDFARLVDRFDQRSVSFVSVTQQFNTTTSLGRLTLNILLSFAQFEREIIGERTRDKMSAARRKGKWTGGMPVLGYDVDPRGGRLVVNELEAARVREIFRLYDTQRSAATVLTMIQQRGWTMKSWMTKRGIEHVGGPFSKPALLRLLTNAIYVGKVDHKGVLYSGEHSAIVEASLWESVNADLRAARRGRNTVTRAAQNTLLGGLLFCKNCDQPMKPTYTAKGDRRYRYYVCRAVGAKGRNACPTKAVSAGAIEESVVVQLQSALSAEDTRQQLDIPEVAWQAFRENGSGDFVRAIVKRVAYDSTSGRVTLELGR